MTEFEKMRDQTNYLASKPRYEILDGLPIIKRWSSFDPSDPNLQNDL